MTEAWPMVPLREVLTERREVPSAEALAKGEIRIVAKIGFNDGKIQLRNGGESKTGMILALPGDLLISGINAAKGAIAMYGEENTDPIAATIHYGAYVPKKDKVHVRYLWWLLRSKIFRDLLERYVPGGIKTELKAKRLLPIPVPLPSLAEQRRIVAKIDELAAKIDEASTLRQRADKESEALTHSIARALLSKINQKTTQLEQWLHPTRDGIQTGPFGAQLSSAEFVGSGIPLLCIGNVQYSGLNLRRLKFVSPSKAEQLSRYRVSEGDILFARMGTVGRCCIVPKEAHGWLINYHIIRVALDATRVEPRFIHWIIQASAEIEGYLKDHIRGATREGVNSKIVAALPCRVPPLPEQRRIVAELDAMQSKASRVKDIQAETTGELDALLPSILDKAFKGEL
jgi:type I restriction enzyme S subunit